MKISVKFNKQFGLKQALIFEFQPTEGKNTRTSRMTIFMDDPYYQISEGRFSLKEFSSGFRVRSYSELAFDVTDLQRQEKSQYSSCQGSSINDVTALKERGCQGFCDNKAEVFGTEKSGRPLFNAMSRLISLLYTFLISILY